LRSVILGGLADRPRVAPEPTSPDPALTIPFEAGSHEPPGPGMGLNRAAAHHGGGASSRYPGRAGRSARNSV